MQEKTVKYYENDCSMNLLLNADFLNSINSVIIVK